MAKHLFTEVAVFAFSLHIIVASGQNLQVHERLLSALESRLNNISTQCGRETNALDRRLTAMESRLRTNVFFTAHTSRSPIDVGEASPIIFDVVVTNVGNAYSPRLGVFTAPVSGDYVFYGQIMHDKSRSREYMKWAIDSAGTRLCANEVNGEATHTPSSCLATVRLQQGDHVFVRRVGGNRMIHGGDWCSFSGFLLPA